MVVHLYLRAINSHPLSTKVLSATFIAFLGDSIAQKLSRPESPINLRRTARFTLWATITTPLVHTWYKSVILKIKEPVRRMLVEQLIWAPPSTASFLFYMGGGGQNGLDNTQQRFPRTYMANLALWVPVSYLNFRFVPPPLWILTNNVVGLGWSVVLSILSTPTPKNQ